MAVPPLSSAAAAASLPPMTVDDVLGFCFPKGRDTGVGESPIGRLEVLARFGPLDGDGRIRGGRKGQHRLEDREVRQMAQELHTRMWQRSLGRDNVEDLVWVTLGLEGPETKSLHRPEDLRFILRSAIDDNDQDAFEAEAEVDGGGRCRIDFARMQKAVFADLKSRLKIVKGCTRKGKPLRPQEYLKPFREAIAARAERERIGPTPMQAVEQQMQRAKNGIILIGPIDVTDMAKDGSGSSRPPRLSAITYGDIAGPKLKLQKRIARKRGVPPSPSRRGDSPERPPAPGLGLPPFRPRRSTHGPSSWWGLT